MVYYVQPAKLQWHFLVLRSVKSLPGVELRQVHKGSKLSLCNNNKKETQLSHNATWHAPHVQHKSQANVANMSSLFKRWPKTNWQVNAAHGWVFGSSWTTSWMLLLLVACLLVPRWVRISAPIAADDVATHTHTHVHTLATRRHQRAHTFRS